MTLPRMPHERRVKKLLGLPYRLGDTDWGKEVKEADIAQGDGEQHRPIRFNVLSAEQADQRSRQINGDTKPGRGRPRVMAECDYCGIWVSAGRFNQHYASHPKEDQ